MKKLWMIMGLAVGVVCQGRGGQSPLPADAASWSVVKLVKAGRDAMASGDRALARALADAAVTRDPGYGDAWKLMGMIRLQMGETNAASQAFRTALLIAPGDAATNLELAWLVWNEDQAKALASLDTVMQSDISDRDELIRRILPLLAETGQEAKAIELFKKWKPTYTMGELGVSLFYDGRRTAAYPFLNAVWQANEERPLVGLYLASLDASKGKPERVSTCLKTYLEKAPATLPKEEAEILWGAVTGAAHDDILKEVWAQIERRYPQEQERRAALAKRFEEAAATVRRRGDLALASEFCRQAVALDPDRPSWADWIQLEERLSGEEKARQCVAELLSRVTVPEIREGVQARTAHYRGDLKAAIKGYRASLSARPGQLALRFFLVRALLAEGNTREAHQEIQAADAMKGDLTWRDRMEMAEFWYGVGEVGHALNLNPSILLDKSRARAAANDWEGARELASQAVTNQPNNAETWKQLGIVQSRLQRYEESRAALEKAMALNAKDALALQELGWVLWMMKDQGGAKDLWEKTMDQLVTNRLRVARLIVGAMAEEGRKDWALECHARWLPDMKPLATGLEFVRAGRMKAAEPFLNAAWEAGDNKPMSGLYLSRVRVMDGNYAGAPALLRPFIASGLSNASAAEVTVALDCLRVCSSVAGASETLDALANVLVGQPELAAAVTDVYVVYARKEEDRGKLASALSFYEKVFTRDPNRRIWPLAWNLAEQLNDRPRGVALLNRIQAQATNAAVRAGVAGKLAELSGEFALASGRYRDSLKADPDQPEIHQSLFDMSIKSGDLAQARREAEWMEGQVKEGAVLYRAAAAMMWATLGEDRKAEVGWQFLHLAMPEVPFYLNELALAQYRLGQGLKAMDTLKSALPLAPSQLGYELLVEILTALRRPGEVIEWARQGLASYSSPALRRSLAEQVENVTTSRTATITMEPAQASLPDDPGSSLRALMLARSLALSGRTDQAAERHDEYLRRNPDFAPSLVYLRDYELLAGKPRRAIPYAERLLQARPWDDVAMKQYVMAVAEADGFSRAIRLMEPLAGQEETSVLALLLYENVTPFDYAGMNTVSQMVAHISRMAKEGFAFANSYPVSSPKAPTVMVIVVEPDSAVVEALDKALAAHDACAVLIVNPDCLRRAFPRKPTPKRLAELARSGRWQIGIIPAGQREVAVRPDGIKGNPLTHRIMAGDTLETFEAMSNRLAAVLAPAAAALGEGRARMLYYPDGDYGQFSLDTDRAAINMLSNVVGRTFDVAFCRDDNGFVSGAADRARLPAKTVPSAWDADALVNHLKERNSVVQARLQLAKLFYWNGQSEIAAHWFRKAREAGANPFEITFNEAANAAMERDLPVALKKSREAVKLAPLDDPRPPALLEKVEEMRQPTTELKGSYWEDNEDRLYDSISAEAEGPIADWLRWTAGAGRHDWETKTAGHERGTSAELGFLAYVAPEVWVKAGLQEWLMDSRPDITGWDTRLHLPNSSCHGNVELYSQREMMETVESLRKDITAHREGLDTYSRLYDFWDCYANAAYSTRSDGNNTWWGDVRLIRRLKETPYAGLGYSGRFADSTEEVPEYWSPQELQQHQAYAAVQASGLRWGCQLSAQAGYAKERDTTWRFIWGTRLAAHYRLLKRLDTGAAVTYQEGPVYNRSSADAFVNVRW